MFFTWTVNSAALASIFRDDLRRGGGVRLRQREVIGVDHAHRGRLARRAAHRAPQPARQTIVALVRYLPLMARMRRDETPSSWGHVRLRTGVATVM